jgi:hypothetical protein
MKRIFAALALFAAVSAGSALAQTSPYSGGTGIRNPNSSTLTLGGALTTAGSFATTLTMTAPTSLILPTSGTLLSTTNPINVGANSITGGAGTFTSVSATGIITATSIGGGSGLVAIAQDGTASARVTAGSSVAQWASRNLGDTADVQGIYEGASHLFRVNGVTIATIFSSGIALSGALSSTALNDDAGNLIMSSTNPTIASGFGTGPTCSPCNNTAAFKITVGSAPSSAGNITLPTAANGWACRGNNLSLGGGVNTVINQVAGATPATLATMVQVSLVNGLALAYTAGDVLVFNCIAY